jgi:hypothetical protein
MTAGVAAKAQWPGNIAAASAFHLKWAGEMREVTSA